MGDDGERDVEQILPAAQFGTLTPAMVPERLPLRRSMSGDVAFAYVEIGRERFGWLADPSGLSGEVGDVLAPGGWGVDKAGRRSSEAAARVAASIEAAGAMGYTVRLVGERCVISPPLAEFADPARFVRLIAEATKRDASH